MMLLLRRWRRKRPRRYYGKVLMKFQISQHLSQHLNYPSNRMSLPMKLKVPPCRSRPRAKSTTTPIADIFGRAVLQFLWKKPLITAISLARYVRQNKIQENRSAIFHRNHSLFSIHHSLFITFLNKKRLVVCNIQQAFLNFRVKR